MKIGGKDFESIIITNSDDDVLAVISDKEIVEYEGYKVMLEPAQ